MRHDLFIVHDLERGTKKYFDNVINATQIALLLSEQKRNVLLYHMHKQAPTPELYFLHVYNRFNEYIEEQIFFSSFLPCAAHADRIWEKGNISGNDNIHIKMMQIPLSYNKTIKEYKK